MSDSIKKIIKAREFGIGIFILLIIVIATIIQPRFLMYQNIRSILLYLPLLIIVAMGEMMVIVSRNFDLSVGSILGCSGIGVGLMFIKYPDFPLVLAFIMAIVIGAILGIINGVLITKLKLPSIIVTLGTLNIYRGLLYIMSGGRQVAGNDIPEELISMAQTSPFIVPWIIIFAFIIAIIAGLFMSYTHVGRQIYAIGSNPLAAKLRGINNDRIIMLVFLISGACAGLAGILYASRFGVLNPNQTGVGFEFVVLAATIIGGTSVSGGSGNVLGTVFGCILLGVVNTALAVLRISGSWQLATYGLIIVIALILDWALKQQGLRVERGAKQ